MGFLGTLLGGGLGFLVGGPQGALIGAGMGGSVDQAGNVQSANAANVQMSQAQMEFQERMSSTAYQRGVKDMEAAGLNPMLAYSQGGASSPGGAMPNIQPVPAAGNMSSALSAMQVLQTGAVTDNTVAATEKLKAETGGALWSSALAEAEYHRRWAGTALDRAHTDYTREGVGGVTADSLRKDLALKLERGTFASDVALRKSQAGLSGLELQKQQLLKGPYELVNRLFPSLTNSADSVRRFLQMPSGSRGPSWESNIDPSVWPAGSY
jgi:hypothetical protein